MKTRLYGLFVEDISALLRPHGFPQYRALQIAEWIYRKGSEDFSSMSNLPIKQREFLSENFSLQTLIPIDSQLSDDRNTEKLLFALSDQASIETVLMRHPYGNSVCVSTQVGCAMGCIFCASGLNSVARNLDCGEILAQVAYFNKRLSNSGEKVDSIVIMGMGEPLANYDQVLSFIRLCHKPYCFDLSYRSFTLSTSGIVPGIIKLAEEKIPITLAISLHAPNDQLRSSLMPVNRRYPIADVLAAADYYTKQSGRRVSYEYILISGVNDKIQHANELAELMQGRLAHVNLIPANPVPEQGLSRPDAKTVAQFETILRQKRISVTVRREMGTEIQAACGQLRRRNAKSLRVGL